MAIPGISKLVPALPDHLSTSLSHPQHKLDRGRCNTVSVLWLGTLWCPYMNQRSFWYHPCEVESALLDHSSLRRGAPKRKSNIQGQKHPKALATRLLDHRLSSPSVLVKARVLGSFLTKEVLLSIWVDILNPCIPSASFMKSKLYNQGVTLGIIVSWCCKRSSYRHKQQCNRLHLDKKLRF